ncbi:MAG TPA: DUF2911 domain-containing protein [Acidobacteriaceae bacterium]|jgi:hypothetical protein|nr:DUF2911 domain-containing protein [Acidobacteriaceae bacterium]
MKRFLMCVGLLALTATTLPAQQQKKPPASPPEKATATVNGNSISILYSSPRVKGREGHIFSKDGLISHDPHYPVWRAGANSATTLETDADLTIGDLSVPKGKYTLFVDISDPDQWTLIVNKQTGEWGLAYNGSNDLGKTKMEMSKPPHTIEDLKWTIDLNGNKGSITLAWEDHSALVPVEVH